MRVFAAILLATSLAALPLLANDANESGKEDLPAAVTPVAAVQPKETVKPESTLIENEVQDLRSLVEEQRAELEAQRAALKAEQLKMEELEKKMGVTSSEPESTPAPITAAVPATTAISTAIPISSSTATLGTPSMAASARPAQDQNNPSPLFIRLGTTELYPLGFMDATSITRTTNMTTQGGGSIGTSFGAIPFNNTILGRDTEEKLSAQNSRIGFRTHSVFGDNEVTGYLEADFLGYLAPSGNVTSNSDSLRLRLYWLDYKRSKIEVLGGQSWSLLTPNRVGLSAIPGDLFIGQEMDTNYYLGLTYTRAAGIRVIVHPTKYWAFGVSVENPQQLLPSTVLEPSTIPAADTANNYGGQFDSNSGNTSSTTGVNNTSIPNLAPDVIAKTAFDADPGGHHVHFDVAGLFRSFKAVNLVASPSSGLTPANTVYTTLHGGALAATLNVELIKNMRWITTSYYSYAGGRYIGNTSGPDVIIKSDGTLSGIHSGSGLSGFEYQITPKFLLYGYYSGAYFGRNVTANPGGATLAGYGYVGSSNSSDRYLFEPEFGFVHTFWKNPNYGDMKVITQYAYVSRTPWYVAPGSPSTAHTSMIYIDLRYDLP